MSEWTRPAQPVRCIVDLTAPLTVRRERGVLVQGDKNANAIVVEVYRPNGVPYDLTGSTVNLTFVRPDKLAVPPIEAEITGNVAVMTLTEACYRLSGMYGADVSLKEGETDRTIVRVIGDIISTNNDGTVDEEGVFPTPEELLETLKQAEQARNNANSAAERANDAAEAIENTTASAQTLATGQDATVSVTDTDEGKHFSFGLPRGARGESGVHVGSDAPTDPSVNVWIDPDSEVGGVDASTLGGKAPDYYLPADAAASDAEKLGGNPPEYYQPAEAAAADAQKLGGRPPEYYQPAEADAVNAKKLGGKAPEYYLYPHNLLDNTHFKNPANQRGVTSWSSGYGLDRWFVENGTASVTADGVIVSVGGYLVQRVPANVMDTAKTYTLAVCDTNGNVYVGSAAGLVEPDDGTRGFWSIKLSGGSTYKWAALYEGSYTAATIPPYVPKGYAAELLECQRYYLHGVGRFTPVVFIDTTEAVMSVATPVQMRTTPTVILDYADNIIVDNNGSSNVIGILDAAVREFTSNSVVINLSHNWDGAVTYITGMTYATRISLSADL